MRRATLSIEPLFVRGVSDGSEASREPLRNVQGRLSSVFPSCTTQRWVKGNDKAKRAMHPNPVQLPSEWYDYWLSNLTSANPLASQVTANAETRQLFSRLNPANYAFDPSFSPSSMRKNLGSSRSSWRSSGVPGWAARECR